VDRIDRISVPTYDTLAVNALFVLLLIKLMNDNAAVIECKVRLLIVPAKDSVPVRRLAKTEPVTIDPINDRTAVIVRSVDLVNTPENEELADIPWVEDLVCAPVKGRLPARNLPARFVIAPTKDSVATRVVRPALDSDPMNDNVPVLVVLVLFVAAPINDSVPVAE